MGIRVGIGSILIPQGFSWPSYWSTRFPSVLIAVNAGDTEMNLSWANNGAADYTGHKVYISTDNISFTLNKTIASIGTSTSITGLTKDTLYYFKVAMYKEGSISSYSNTYSVTTGIWYTAGEIDPATVVGAYKFTGAADEAASLVNIANPGTNDLTKVSTPVWDKTLGWGGFFNNKYLNGPVCKTKTYSVVILVASGYKLVNNIGRAFSCERDATGSKDCFIAPITTLDSNYLLNGNEFTSGPNYSQGVFGVTQTNTFVNGVSQGAIINSGTESSLACRIGMDSFILGGTTDNYWFTGNVLAFAIYNYSLTDAQMIAVSNRMKEESFVIPMRDFSTLTRYVGNPIILHNTISTNVYGADTPYVKIANKIGNYYYAPTQSSAVSGDWNDFDIIRSLDLLAWEPVGSHPALTHEVGEWDEKYLIHPSVIKVGAEWWMYYSGANNAGLHQIGLAKSSDFLTWVKYVGNPVYTHAGNDASCPWVIQIGATYYMYYWTHGTGVNIDYIHYATSPDLINWTYGGIALIPFINDSIYGYALLDPYVGLRADGIYEMIFTYAKWIPALSQILGYAVSYDGKNWFLHQSAILEAFGAGWEAGYVGDGVLIDNPITGKPNLFYAGIASITPGSDNSDGGVAIIT